MQSDHQKTHQPHSLLGLAVAPLRLTKRVFGFAFNTGDRKMTRPYLAIFVLVLAMSAMYWGQGKKFFGFAFNPNDASCLPELHLAFLLYSRPDVIQRDMYLFWKPRGALGYVTQTYVLKKVAAVPGDRLLINNGEIFVNGELVAHGLEDAPIYHCSEQSFYRSEIVPPNSYFMIGTAQYSNDSRYWGYLPYDEVVGRGFRVY